MAEQIKKSWQELGIYGTTIPSSYLYQSKAPLDARTVVTNYDDLDQLVAKDSAYQGMLVYVKNDGDKQGLYIYDYDSVEKKLTWRAISAGGSLSADTNYAGSSTQGGPADSANKVNNKLTINCNGTMVGEFDGSAAVEIDIKNLDTEVFLSEDLYTNYNIGRFTGASESTRVQIGKKDQSIREMLADIFTAQAETPTITLPSLSLSLSNNSSSIEYGNEVTFTATVTANTGRLNSSYYSGGYTTDTGVSWSTLNLVSTNSTFASKTSGITSGTSFTFTPSTTYYAVASGGTIKGKATAPGGYISSGKVAKNNLGNDTDVKISGSASHKESSEASTSVSAGYVPYAYTLATSLPADTLPSTYNSKNVRSESKPSSITVSGGNADTYLYIFVPSDKSISTIKSGGFGVPFTCVETGKSYVVNNRKSTTFKVYKTDSNVVSNTFDIT